jgi:hypothetical protein
MKHICLFIAGYHAPLDLFVELNKIASDPKIHNLPEDRPVNVCVGKEWYRYPSSFFLPAQKYVIKSFSVFQKNPFLYRSHAFLLFKKENILRMEYNKHILQNGFVIKIF